jgi:hypothetical protein
MHWVQHEVLASQGGTPCKDLCFILQGQASDRLMALVGNSMRVADVVQGRMVASSFSAAALWCIHQRCYCTVIMAVLLSCLWVA